MNTKRQDDLSAARGIFGWSLTMLVSAIVGIFFILDECRADAHPAPQPMKYEFNAGVGFSDSEGSGTIQFGYWPHQNVKTFAQIWTDNSKDGDQFVLQERRTPKGTRTLVLQGDDGDTSNVALGAAYCDYYKSLRYCAGAAVLAEDKTQNINDQVEVYGELGFKLPENKYVDYLGVFAIGSERALGLGRRF